MLNDEKKDEAKVPFEVAIDKAGFGLYSFKMTALTGLVIIAYVCVVYSSSMIVPTSACELETTPSQQGILIGAPLIGSIIGAMFWGYISDTRGRRNILIVSLLSGALVNALASLSVNWIMLMILQFLASILSSGKYSLSMTLLSESVPMAKRNIVVLVVTSIFLLSQGVMALLAMPILPLEYSYHISFLGIYWNSWRTIIVVYSVPSIVSAIWLYFMEESPKFVFEKQGDEHRAIEILSRIHTANKGKKAGDYPVLGLQVMPGAQVTTSAKDQFFPLFKGKLLKVTIIMTSLYMFEQAGTFAVWLPTISEQFTRIIQTGEGYDLTLCNIIDGADGESSESDGSCTLNVDALLIVLYVGIFQSTANLLLSLVINRVGRRNATIILSLVFGASGILINLIPNAFASVILLAVFLTGVLLLGLYTAMNVALFPTQLRAMAVALTMTGGRITTFATAQVLSVMFANNNCQSAFYIFSSIFGSSALIAAFLPDDRYLKKPAETKEDQEDKEDKTLKAV